MRALKRASSNDTPSRENLKTLRASHRTHFYAKYNGINTHTSLRCTANTYCHFQHDFDVARLQESQISGVRLDG